MKRLLLLCLLFLPTLALAGPTFSQPTPKSLAADPASCSTTGAWYQKFYYNTVSNVWKWCSATNTWTAFSGTTGTLTNAANSLPASQVVVGNTYPDTLTTNCTIGVVATDAIKCPGGFFGTSIAANATPVAHELMKWTGGVYVLNTTTDLTDPSTVLTSVVVDASHVYAESPGSQVSAVSHDAVTEGHYALVSGVTNGQLTDSATCTAGQRYFGTWAATAAAGTRLLNYNPGTCPAATTITYSKTIIVGAENGAVLLDADLGPQRKQFQIPAASTITEIDVAADGGTPNVIVAKRVCTASPCVTGANETVTNLLSGALATAASGGTACSRTAAVAGIDGFTTCTNTLQNNTSIAAGTYVELVSGTAGGTAKRMSITVTYTTP